MNIKSSLNDITTHRISELENMLLEISKSKKNIHIHSNSFFNRILFFASNFSTKQLDIDNCRFPTICEIFNASYKEVWIRESNDIYYLERAYLHIYNITSEYTNIREDGEYLLLHSDPNIPITDKHYKCKAGPHIHFQFSPEPISHSHWALSLDSIDNILSDRLTFNSSFKNAIYQLRTQLFEPFDDYLLNQL